MADTFDDRDFLLDAEKQKNSPEVRKKQLSKILLELKNQRERERALFYENVDSEYWFCVCFQTRAQKDEFLSKIGWNSFGDKYLDGLAVAEKQNINLDAKTPPVRKRHISKKWQQLT